MNEVVSPERAATSKISAPAVGFQSSGATVKSKPFFSPGPRDTTVLAPSGSRKNLMSWASALPAGSAALPAPMPA